MQSFCWVVISCRPHAAVLAPAACALAPVADRDRYSPPRYSSHEKSRRSNWTGVELSPAPAPVPQALGAGRRRDVRARVPECWGHAVTATARLKGDVGCSRRVMARGGWPLGRRGVPEGKAAHDVLIPVRTRRSPRGVVHRLLALCGVVSPLFPSLLSPLGLWYGKRAISGILG